jgi:prepilin-type N-terminal cleavage/methylation domain-containing protein
MTVTKKHDTGVRGVTLIEIIITLVVIGIIGAAVMLPFVNSLSGSPNPVWLQQATDLAQGELEQVLANKRASGFASLATSSTPTACSTDPQPSGFTCSRTICFVPVGNLNNVSACTTATAYKQVAVTINHATVGNVSAVLLVTSY